jgi:RNA polymerase sigma-70 factor (ECF subfamily)
MVNWSSDGPSETSFGQLLAGARTGDGAGFDGLYRWLARPIARFASARGADDPEGIANETFLRVFRSLPSFDGDAPAFRAWVHLIARNLMVDAHRAQTRRPVRLDAEVPDQPTVAADEQALDNLASEDVRATLEALTADQRDVILLRMVADLSLTETAAALDKPVSAVKRLQARALRRLQHQILDGRSPDE